MAYVLRGVHRLHSRTALSVQLDSSSDWDSSSLHPQSGLRHAVLLVDPQISKMPAFTGPLFALAPSTCVYTTGRLGHGWH